MSIRLQLRSRRSRGTRFRCRMDLNFMASDFVMPHCTLTQREGKPITPAMAAGLESRVWSMLDVTRRMDEAYPIAA